MMRRAVWIAFAAVCVLSATSWIVPRSEGLPALELQGIRYGLIGVFALFEARGRVQFGSVGLGVGAAGGGVFGVPVGAAWGCGSLGCGWWLGSGRGLVCLRSAGQLYSLWFQWLW